MQADVESPAADSPMLSHLRRLHERFDALADGRVADYIPALAAADPASFGIAVVTVDGALYETGDARTPFTIQSMAKPLTFATVLEQLGPDAVRRRIGVEPTGDAFNAITLAAPTGTPLNPMVNAGAITAVGLAGPGAAATILDAVGRFAGRTLTIDEAVYASERDTGHRNRAIAHLLRSTGALDGDPDEVVDAYFRICAIAVDTRDLAVIAATLAGGGRNPLTGEQVVSAQTAAHVLAVMTSCGMYDGAGAWLFEVGLPAKSGVSGGILAVVPGRLGVAVWSPPLDGHGNSVRGVAVCRELATSLDIHLARPGRDTAPVRTRTSVAAMASKRGRAPSERERLLADPGRSLVLELQGDLTFIAAERVAREALPVGPTPAAVLIDLRRITGIGPGVAVFLADLVAALGDRGAAVAWSGGRPFAAVLDQVDAELGSRRLGPPHRLDELDEGLEWAEEVVLSRTPDGPAAGDPSRHLALEAHPALAGLDEADRARLAGSMDVRRWAQGTVILRQGDPADSMLLVTGGRLSVRVPLVDGDHRRISTLEAGAMVGELSFLGRERRTADVVADTDVEAWVLTADAFDRLTAESPMLAAGFLRTMLRIVSGIARRMTDEVAILAG